MIPYRPERILLERGVEESLITRTVLLRLPEVPVELIDSADLLVERSRSESPTLTRAKRSLILARYKGSFFKACPGQQSRNGVEPNVCCDYFVINFASNCHMECTYCYLQSYLTFPYLIVYANVDELLTELDTAFSSRPEYFFRVGTGELADSLALDPLTGYSRHLVEFFARRTNALLELKTKSDHIDELLSLDHQGRTVVAWSVNPDFIQKTEEFKTATIRERFRAAKTCVEAGYPVAFHFDPMIHYEGWREGYHRLIEELFDRIPASSIAWISLGGLRMPPAQLDLMKQRFPKSRLPLGELVTAADGKLRYFKPIRVELYEALLGWIRDRSTEVKVYACMERPEVWDRALGGRPVSDQSLGASLVGLHL